MKSGDIVALDVTAGSLNLEVAEEELVRRKSAWRPGKPKYPRGYGAIFLQQVTQANEGCDFRFLEGIAPIDEPAIF